MPSTKATARTRAQDDGFLPTRQALLEAARAVPPTSPAAAPASSLTQEPAPTFNAPAAVAAQEPAPPFNAEEMRSFLAQLATISSSDAAPSFSAEQAVAFSRGFRRYVNTITETLLQHPPLRTDAERQELRQPPLPYPPLRTHAEREERRKKRIEAKQKIQEATTFYESANEALRQHKTLVQEAENFVNERREALEYAELDYNVKRARTSAFENDVALAKGDLMRAKNAYEAMKAQDERQ